MNTATGLPGLLSFSSFSSRPPETPRSLDWSCTFILSLLLILHTELLEAVKMGTDDGTEGSQKDLLRDFLSLLR